MSSGKHLSVEKYRWIKTSLAGNFDSSKDLETDREMNKLKVVLLIVCKESELSFAFSVLINY